MLLLNRKSNNRQSYHAFTLIELLVVIAVITLLIALLLPVLAKAREAGYRVKCLSGARQAAIAVRMYANASKEYIPTHAYHYSMLPQVGGPGFQVLLADGSFTQTIPSDPATPMPGGGYVSRDLFTSRGGCPYGPADYSESSGGEFYSDPNTPITSYGIPGQIQTGYDNVGGHTDYGPYRFSDKRLAAFSDSVAIISCSYLPWGGGAILNFIPPNPSGAGWYSEARAGNPPEPTAWPVLWHTLGALVPAVGNDNYQPGLQADGPYRRHWGEGLPMAFADGHGVFVPRAEVLDKPNPNSVGGPYWSTKPQYIRMLRTFAPKYSVAGLDQ